MPVELRVENSDALDFSCDLLILKYAQRLNGLDAAAADRMGLHRERFPAVGEHLLVRNPPTVRARNVLFIGVPTLREFNYREIRAFVELGLEVAQREVPDARHIGLTLHGTGYGLDELEALDSQVDGVYSAVAVGRAPDGLVTVTVVERDPGRTQRLRKQLTQRAKPGGAAIDQPSPFHEELAKPRAFVAMPFDKAYDDRYHYGISPPLRASGHVCERMDQIAFTGDIVDLMRRRIESSRVVVADVSGSNPNVYLEIGYAWATGVPTVLLCDAESEPLFDIRGHRHIRFQTIRELEVSLGKELDALFPADLGAGVGHGR